ncbi:unnamed protein product [Linum trigynum]|uniref:Uncharacterized protein n=1 Tax=Linum trigynum TaxID=586398 RepID=A0AAV2FB54_9ROSI
MKGFTEAKAQDGVVLLDSSRMKKPRSDTVSPGERSIKALDGVILLDSGRRKNSRNDTISPEKRSVKALNDVVCSTQAG